MENVVTVFVEFFMRGEQEKQILRTDLGGQVQGCWYKKVWVVLLEGVNQVKSLEVHEGSHDSSLTELHLDP